MKNLFFLFLLLSSTLLYSQDAKEYGAGVILWGAYDLTHQKVHQELEKCADIIKVEKKENDYILYGKDSKGKFKLTYKKTKGVGEEGKYVDDNADIYYIKDLLDTKVKALDILNSSILPGFTDKAMILRIFIF